MSTEASNTAVGAATEDKQKRKRRTKAEMEAARAEASTESAKPEKESVSGNSAKPSEGVAAPSIGDSVGSNIWLQNASENPLVIPLTPFIRQKIFPSHPWNVPAEYVGVVKDWMGTDYFKNLESDGSIKVLDRMPSRLGELDLNKFKTPEPPKTLDTPDDEHITQAGFVKQSN